MADMRLVVAGAGGRMGRTLVKAIAESKGLTLAGALEDARSPLIGWDAGTLAGLGENGVKLIGDAGDAARRGRRHHRFHHAGRDRRLRRARRASTATCMSSAPPGFSADGRSQDRGRPPSAP